MPVATRDKGTKAYERHKLRAAKRQKELSQSGREIYRPGCLKVKNWRRKRRALDSLEAFCKSYFPDVFYLPFSADHLRVIAKMEAIVNDGGQLAFAMPRGSGKSALCAAAALWAVLKGVHLYVLLIGATETDATTTLKGIREHLETNDILLEDFPEVCWPIRCLEGIPQRRLLWKGRLIRMELKEGEIVFPSLPASPAAGAILGVAGLTGRIRGRKHVRSDGREVRPSLVFLDDPQDDEAAASPAQCAKRESIINGAVLGLAGPDSKISAFMPCTVICPDDLADRLLNRDRNPQWRGELTKLIYQWPKGADSEKLWDEYAEMRRQILREGRDLRECDRFVEDHHDAMHAGSEVAWAERHPGAVSTLQYAYNIRLERGDAAFNAEYQNEPPKPKLLEEQPLDAHTLCQRLNRAAWGTAPGRSTVLTAFIDCSKEVLYWVVCGWWEGFSGGVVAYGAWPDQGPRYFKHESLPGRTLQIELPGASEEAQLFKGLKDCSEFLIGREWPLDGGGGLRIRRCLIDARWQTDLVFGFCRQSAHSAVLVPSMGRDVRASDFGIRIFTGDIGGLECKMTPAKRHPGLRYCSVDTNFWKSFAASRLLTPEGAHGALMLPGADPRVHRMLADHCTAEVRVPTMARERLKDEWRQKPNTDNHWWDGIVGCCVGASWEGIELEENQAAKPKYVSFAAQQAARRSG